MNDLSEKGFDIQRHLFLRLLGALPFLILLVPPLYVYIARPDDTELFTWILGVEAALCIVLIVLICVRRHGAVGYRLNNGRTVMTERGLCEYMIGPHVKAVRPSGFSPARA